MFNSLEMALRELRGSPCTFSTFIVFVCDARRKDTIVRRKRIKILSEPSGCKNFPALFNREIQILIRINTKFIDLENRSSKHSISFRIVYPFLLFVSCSNLRNCVTILLLKKFFAIKSKILKYETLQDLIKSNFESIISA